MYYSTVEYNNQILNSLFVYMTTIRSVWLVCARGPSRTSLAVIAGRMKRVRNDNLADMHIIKPIVVGIRTRGHRT